MNPLTNCPACQAPLSNYEQKERECFSCAWSEYENPNSTIATAPRDYEYDTELDDETMD